MPLIIGGLGALLVLCLAGTIAAFVALRGGTATPTASRSAPSPTTAVAARATGTATVPASGPTAAPSPSTGATRTAAPSAPASVGNWGPNLAPLSGGSRHDDPKGRFTFSTPSGWLELPSSGNIAATFAGPITGATIPPTMNVYLEDISGLPDRTLDTFAQQSSQVSVAHIRADYPDYTGFKRDKGVVNGLPAYRLVFTATISGNRLQLQQVFLIDPARPVAHLLTLGSLPGAVAANAATFDGIAGTYQVKP